ncbi:S1C family serine protease [Bradyrhizobium sp. 2TAF24]|uniref:S1C family serine protease n=1 Tax=Bradyrhizobium sp. 2TAF24 TaxID=3233011 RepID=UPI003F8F5222
MAMNGNTTNGVRHLVTAWADRVLALDNEDGSRASAIAWRKGLVVSADEAAGDQIKLFAGDGRQVGAEFAGRDPTTDVALYRADVDPPPVEPAPAVAPGDFALAIGRGATSECVAAGVVAETGDAWRSSLGGTIDRRIRLDLRLARRAHGGAIVDAAGKLIGLAAFGPRRTAIVIPTETVERIVDRLVSAGSIARGYIGVQLHPLSDGHRGVGAIIVRLDDGGPAATAGLVVGDSIISWNGEAISGVRDIFRRLGPDSVGTTVKLGLLRAHQPATIDIVVGQRPLK